jgi:hypothetical protein
MSNFHDFLVEQALFPFPEPDEARSICCTDISEIEVGLLETEWKAKHAVRDDTLVQKLCDVLKKILGDRVLPADDNFLLAAFSPKLEVDEIPGRPGMLDLAWLKNPNEAHVSFPKDFFTAEQFELALTLRTDSVVVTHRFLRRRSQVFGCVWVTCLLYLSGSLGRRR